MKDTLVINPRASALLVLDIQKIILDCSAGPPSAAEKDAFLSRNASLIGTSSRRASVSSGTAGRRPSRSVQCGAGDATSLHIRRTRPPIATVGAPLEAGGASGTMGAAPTRTDASPGWVTPRRKT